MGGRGFKEKNINIPPGLLHYDSDIIGGIFMPKVTVDIPKELYDDMMGHVGADRKFVNQSDAIRTAIRKMLDIMDQIDERHGRLKDDSRTE